MVIAALASFGVLLVAWLLAPDRPHTRKVVEKKVPDAHPVIA